MSNVSEKHRHLESISSAELERRILDMAKLDHDKMTDDELELAVALHTIARRKTAGPPKARGTSRAVDAAALLADL